MGKKVCSRKKVFVKERLSKRNKISFLFISLPWLSNELLWSINKLKQGLWCTIWLSYIYIYIYIWYYFIYLFIYLFIFWLLYGVSVEMCFHIYFSFCESIYLFTYLFGGAVGEFVFGTVACWWHAIVSTMKYSAPLQGCFLWGSVFPVKTMVSLCFCLKWTSPRTLDTFLALFITHLCCSN